MRGCIEKRAAGGYSFSRNGSNLASRNPNLEEGSIRCCNRLGCSTRYYSLNSTQTGNTQKAKNPKASLHSLSSKTLSGISSNSPKAFSNSRKSHQEKRTRISTQDIIIAGRSSRHGEGEDSESSNSQGEIETIASAALANCRTKSKSRTLMEGSSSSSIRHSSASRNISQANNYASGCSSSDSGRSTRLDMARKRPSEGQYSSRGKSIAPSNGGYTGPRLRGPSAPSLSHPESSLPQQTARKPLQTARKARSRPIKPLSSTRLRLSEQGDGRSLSLSVPVVASELPQVDLLVSGDAPECSSRSFSMDLPSIFLNTSRERGFSSRTAQVTPISQLVDSNAGVSRGLLEDRVGYRSTRIEGIAEVLLALERIEQNEELTYEQLLILEANFPMGGLAFEDRHRDMRLDIDNMSYEELLALEEKMGNVSTALTEEAMSRCLERSIYSLPFLLQRTDDGYGDDDTKCSICQEEYSNGDEVGKLACKHSFHLVCVHQWLGQKNWCPICKASACPL